MNRALVFTLLTAISGNQALASDTELDSFLELPLEALAQIKVYSATKTPTKLVDTPATVSVITRDSLDHFQFDSVADSLSSQAGIDVLYDLSLYNIGMRGIPGGLAAQGQGVKVMIDSQDMTFRTTSTAFIGPEFIPNIAIDRIEVVRGPLSPVYGADAFTGVINVIPRRKPRGKEFELELKQSIKHRDNQSGWQTELFFAGGNSSLSYTTALSILENNRAGLTLPSSSPRFDALAQSSDLQMDQDREKTLSLWGSVNLSTDFGSWQLNYNRQQLSRNANFFPDSEPLSDANIEFSQHMANIKWEHALSDRLATHASFAINQGDTGDDNRLFDPFRSGLLYLYRDYQFESLTSDFYIHFQQQEWEIVTGLDYHFDTEDLPTLYAVDLQKATQALGDTRQIELDNLGAYIQFSRDLTEKATLTLGGRHDKHSIYENHSSFRGGIIYRYSGATHFKLLAGSSFKAPAPILMFGGEHPRLLGPAPNNQLEPQKALTVEAFAGTDFYNLGKLGVTLFRSKVNDFAEYDTIAANPIARNRGEITASGLEVELLYSDEARQQHAYCHATYVHTKVSTDVPFGIEVSDEVRLYPQFSLGMGFSKKLHELPVQWFVRTNYYGERQADKSNLAFLPLGQQQEYQLSGYWLSHLGLETSHWHMTDSQTLAWQFKLENIFNEPYVEPGFSGVDVPGLKRRLTLALKYHYQ